MFRFHVSENVLSSPSHLNNGLASHCGFIPLEDFTPWCFATIVADKTQQYRCNCFSFIGNIPFLSENSNSLLALKFPLSGSAR
jgi:hypothetical protein